MKKPSHTQCQTTPKGILPSRLTRHIPSHLDQRRALLCALYMFRHVLCEMSAWRRGRRTVIKSSYLSRIAEVRTVPQHDQRACTSSHLVSYQRPDDHSWAEGTMDRLSDALLQYHDRSKHRVDHYAPGPRELDWSPAESVPGVSRRCAHRAALAADTSRHRYNELRRGALPPPRMDLTSNLAILFELSLGLSAWKAYRAHAWALRCNPRAAICIRPRAIW